MKKLTLSIVATAALALAAPSARAALLTIDQQNTSGSITGGSSTDGGTTLGQSFTPTTALINAATFMLRANSGTTVTVRMDLFAGQTIAGTPLASSAVLTLTNTAFQSVEFDLLSPVVLIPNTLYTVALAQTTPSNLGILLGGGNPYAGGQALYGSFSTGFDTVFAEGSTVPEPSTWATVGLGLAGLGVVTLRRRRAAARA